MLCRNHTSVCCLRVLDILIFLYVFTFTSSLTIVALVVALDYLNLGVSNENSLDLTHHPNRYVSIVEHYQL